MKNKLNIVFYIVIGVLTVIAGLEGLYIFNHKNPSSSSKDKEIVKYIGPNYLKENITYKNSDNLTLDAQIYKNNEMLLITAKTLEKPIINSKIYIEFYDANEKLVEKQECVINLLEANEKYACLKQMPKVSDDVYAGNIIISSEINYFETDSKTYDRDLAKFEASSNIDNTSKITTLNFESENPYEDLQYLDGYVLIYKNDKIKDVVYFNVNKTDITSDKIKFSIVTGPLLENNELKIVEYDKYEVVINNLY